MQMWSHEYFASTQVVKGELGKEQPQRGKYLLFVDILANLNTVMYANLRKCKKKTSAGMSTVKTINQKKQKHMDGGDDVTRQIKCLPNASEKLGVCY